MRQRSKVSKIWTANRNVNQSNYLLKRIRQFCNKNEACVSNAKLECSRYKSAAFPLVLAVWVAFFNMWQQCVLTIGLKVSNQFLNTNKTKCYHHYNDAVGYAALV